MKLCYPSGEYLRRLEIWKNGEMVWKLDGVHVDTTNLNVPEQIKPPFIFKVIENDEVVYSSEYDKNDVLIEVVEPEVVEPEVVEIEMTSDADISDDS